MVRIPFSAVYTAALNPGFSPEVIPGVSLPSALPVVAFDGVTGFFHPFRMNTNKSKVTKRKTVLLNFVFFIGRKYYLSYIKSRHFFDIRFFMATRIYLFYSVSGKFFDRKPLCKCY